MTRKAEDRMVVWFAALIVIGAVAFGSFVISYTAAESGRFPIIWVLLGFGMGMAIWGAGAWAFGLHNPGEVIRTEEQAQARIAQPEQPRQETLPHSSHSSDLYREKVLQAGLDIGTLGIDTLWKQRFRDTDLTYDGLLKVLQNLEGYVWAAPDGHQYRVTEAVPEKRIGRKLERIE